MGYVKKAYRNIFEYLDNNEMYYQGWNEFVDKKSIPHNLIIKKGKGICHCTNCDNDFFSNKKVGEETKCPNCKNKYLIKRSNLRYYDFKDYLSILERVNNQYVIRYYELKTIIDANYKHHSYVSEFAREIVTDDWYREIFVNERVSKCTGHIYIYHGNDYYIDDKKWRSYDRGYSLIDYSIVFSNNLKKLFKNTEYKYSCIWKIAKNCEYIDLPKLLKNKNFLYKVEMLAKMGLYNLALKYENFDNTGSFQKIFGVSKDFYPFMKRYNITNTQLKILKLLNEKNINKIRYLERFTDYYSGMHYLEEVSKYIDLNKLIKYSKMHHGKFDKDLYKDYLKFASFLDFDLKNKKYVFPKNLKEEHDKLEKQYKINNQKLIDSKIKKRAKVLSINEYKSKEYIIIPAKSLEALNNESKQQSNCVRTYAEDYSLGTCDIYFMRKTDSPDKSLVTVEVKGNTVVQSRAKHNSSLKENEQKFLDKWEEKVLRRAA